MGKRTKIFRYKCDLLSISTDIMNDNKFIDFFFDQVQENPPSIIIYNNLLNSTFFFFFFFHINNCNFILSSLVFPYVLSYSLGILVFLPSLLLSLLLRTLPLIYIYIYSIHTEKVSVQDTKGQKIIIIKSSYNV